MMNISKSDILELRRRMTKKSCSIDLLRGCYVGPNKNIILKFEEDFSQVDEDTFFKYLDIAKKILSTSLGANILELEFQRTETGNEHQKYLYALKADTQDNSELVDRLYEKIIENFSFVGNYLILLFHDIYDVPSRTRDRMKLDESVERFEYTICAVCPVDFSKADLSYCEDENSIELTERNWIVGQPDLGFMYPAFANHGADASAVMYYVRTGKDSHAEFIEEVLGCDPQRTAGEEKRTFREIIENTFEDEQQAESVFLKVQKQISDLTMPDPDAPIEDDETPPVTLTKQALEEVVAAVDMPEEARESIKLAFEHEFEDQPPIAQNVLDKKLVEESVQRLRTAELQTKVDDLTEELTKRSDELTDAKKTVKELENQVTAGAAPEAEADTAISLHVTPAKAKQIYAKNLNGVRCIIIPMEKGDSASINGIAADFSAGSDT